MNSLFKNRFLIAYYDQDDQYIDNNFCRTEKDARDEAKWHLSDQYKRFGIKLIARIYNELKYKPEDRGIEIRMI